MTDKALCVAMSGAGDSVFSVQFSVFSLERWTGGVMECWSDVRFSIGPFRALYIIGGQRAEFSIWGKDFLRII